MKIMYRLIICALVIIIPYTAFGQKKKCKEGCAPHVTYYLYEGDSLLGLFTLKKGIENKMKIVLDGGIEQVDHKMVVSSKNAIVRKDENEKNIYYVTPQHDICELIVDVKTYEMYYHVKVAMHGEDQQKKVIQEFPPRTYMVSYERFTVGK